VDETHPNRPETETAIMSGNKDSNAQEITKSMKKRPIVCRRVCMKHHIRPETETERMSDNKDSIAPEITKSIKKGPLFCRRVDSSNRVPWAPFPA